MSMDLKSILSSPNEGMLSEPVFSLSDGTIVNEDKVGDHVEVFPLGGLLDEANASLDEVNGRMDDIHNTREAILTISDSSMESHDKKKVMKLLGDGLNRLVERTDSVEYTLESYHDPIGSTLGVVSQEGFVKVLKSIWNAIKALVVGIYRTIIDFFKSLFGVEKKTDDTIKESKKQLEYIEKNGSNYEPENAKNIGSKLLTILNLTYNDVDDYELIANRCLTISSLYKVHLNDSILPFITSVGDTIIKPIDNILKDITSKKIDTSTITNVILHYNTIISGLGSLTEGILPYVISPGELPPDVYDKLFNKVDMDKVNIRINALTPTNEPNQFLARKFNVFSIVDMSVTNIDGLLAKDQKEPVFNFSSYKFRDDSESKESLKPIPDVNLLRKMQDWMDNNDEAINLKDLENKVKRLSESIVRTTDYVAARGHVDIERLATVVGGEPDYREFIILFLNKLMTVDDSFIEILSEQKGNKFADLFIDPITMTTIYQETMSKGKDKVADRLMAEMKGSVISFAKAIGQDPKYNHYGIHGPSGGSTQVDSNLIEKYKDLDKLLDALLRSSLTNFNKALGMLGADFSSTYIEFRDSAANYLAASMKQHI